MTEDGLDYEYEITATYHDREGAIHTVTRCVLVRGPRMWDAIDRFRAAEQLSRRHIEELEAREQ